MYHKMKKFKLIPVVTFHEKNSDRDKKPEAHYTFEIKNIVISPIIMADRQEEDDTYDSYIMDDTTILDSNELLDEVSTHVKNDLSGVKTIYFDDTCKVPRFKLGEICGTHGIKVVRERDKADAVIYGNKFTESIFTTTSADSFNYKEDFIAQARKVKCKRNLAEIIPLVEACESDIVLLENKDEGNGVYEDRLCIQKRIKTDDGPAFDIDYTEISDESKYLLLTGKNNLIYQDVILEQLSSIVMDEDMFKSVNNMFESKDESNHTVAMEVMSNTAYRKSIVYLLELMRRHHNIIDLVYEKRHISFKALREYLQFDDSSEMDELIDVVITKKALTESNYKLILKLIIENEFKSTEDNKGRWVITSVDLAPEQKSKVIWDKKEELILTEAL